MHLTINIQLTVRVLKSPNKQRRTSAVTYGSDSAQETCAPEGARFLRMAHAILPPPQWVPVLFHLPPMVSPPVAEVKPLIRLFSDEDALGRELKNIHALRANRAAPDRSPRTRPMGQTGQTMSVRVFALGIGIACSQGAPIHRGHRAARRRYLGGPD
jgi:hypothetical protein